MERDRQRVSASFPFWAALPALWVLAAAASAEHPLERQGTACPLQQPPFDRGLYRKGALQKTISLIAKTIRGAGQCCISSASARSTASSLRSDQGYKGVCDASLE